MKSLIASVLFTTAALVGCSEKEIVQTVDWYKTQDADRKAMVAKCKANPGELILTPNCVNAKQADNEKALSRRGWLKPDAVDLGKDKG
jgi:hypothetical protein